jgi:hypothetical protein
MDMAVNPPFTQGSPNVASDAEIPMVTISSDDDHQNDDHNAEATLLQANEAHGESNEAGDIATSEAAVSLQEWRLRRPYARLATPEEAERIRRNIEETTGIPESPGDVWISY